MPEIRVGVRSSVSPGLSWLCPPLYEGLTLKPPAAHGSNYGLRSPRSCKWVLRPPWKSQQRWTSTASLSLEITALHWLGSCVCLKPITVAWGRDSTAWTDSRTCVLMLKSEVSSFWSTRASRGCLLEGSEWWGGHSQVSTAGTGLGFECSILSNPRTS